MKRFLFILILLLNLPVYGADVLYGEAEYNVNSVRTMVSDGVVYKLNPNIFASKVLDYDNQSNLQNILNGNLNLKDRTLAVFSDSSYGVLYNDDPYNVYYFSSDGILMYVDKKDSLEYPYKFYKYDVTGNLINMGLRVSLNETYIYSKDKKLIAHWVGQNAFDENNNIIMKRKISK